MYHGLSQTNLTNYVVEEMIQATPKNKLVSIGWEGSIVERELRHHPKAKASIC